MTGASKKKLIETIAREIGYRTTPTALAACLEEFRDEFAAVFADAPPKQQRDRLLEIERTCLEAATAVGHAPREVDWLRGKFHLGGDQWIEISYASSTEPSVLLWGLAQAARKAAGDIVLPNARSIPTKDAAALYCWMLFAEFYRQPQTTQPASRKAAEYVQANWPKLSPAFRKAYNQLRTARHLPPIPDPDVDLHKPPTPAKAPQFPWARYLAATEFLFEYLTGAAVVSFETACRKMLTKYARRQRG
jgi:hypothetical protein